METITIEKVIKFDNTIDSIDTVQVNNELRYELLDDDTHVKGTINLSGSVNTILGQKDFYEDVDVDIYAPFEKIIDRDKFKMVVKDYSFMINQQNLIVYLVIDMDGIVSAEDNKTLTQSENTLEDITDIQTDPEEVKISGEIIEDINKLNEINDNTLYNIREDERDNNCHISIKENDNKEIIDNNWATDLFKLTDNYSVFMKIHID